MFTQSVTTLSGVGAKRAETLASLGIFTVEDLITYYPFRYEDVQERQLTEIMDQEKVTLKGIVVTPPVVSRFGCKKNRLQFKMKQNDEVFQVSFFNQAYLKDKVVPFEELVVYGKWDAARASLAGMKILGSGQQSDFAPVYHVNKTIRQKTLQDLIVKALELYEQQIEEILPQSLIDKYRLLPRSQAVRAMHVPKTHQEYEQAKRRVIFEEFFLFQMNIQGLKAKERDAKEGLAIHYEPNELKAFIQTLPFELTTAQKKVTNEICADLKSPKHMQRLLQGDVGSGKTIVAAIALYATKTAGFQGALMVPTEILAQQHMESLTHLFEQTSLTVALLTGSTKTRERQEILAGLANGTIDVVVGTHALIQDDVAFSHLGLVITDEQHRFGVNQRKILREKGLKPDVLFMTATPIPRTLAITAYGEMDVSIIDELPKGRIPIETRWIKPPQLSDALAFARGELKKGHQMYVICPLIEESETLDVKNAQAIYEELQQAFPDFAVGLLHGKMRPSEKDQIMEAFKENETQILVSTTVIEVGVNIPNASVMIIMDADRFGLAQLHQLRGRVGRGQTASYCILVAQPKNDIGKERMKIMTETTNGFIVSERDLALRGPGEVFGNRQSGIPEFMIADLVEHAHILEVAQQEASAIFKQSNWNVLPEYAMLHAYLVQNQQQNGSFD